MNLKYEKLIKNTVIFTIGSFGTKILSFLIIPLYTFVLTVEEYGKIDLFVTSISLMIPFSTLMIQESLIRLIPTKEIDKKTAITNSLVIVIGGVLLNFFLIPFYKYGLNFGKYTFLFIIILSLNIYNVIFSQYLRAVEKNVGFIAFGFLNTLVMLVCNILFLVVFKFGMIGYYYSILISQLICAFYLSIYNDIFKNFNIRDIQFSKLIIMLKYSIPLIPNNLMWWIMGAGDKYILNYFLGDSANGIYSISMKIPTIISMVYNIFMQAWQFSAIEENNSKDSETFYQNVFSIISSIIILITGVINLIIYPIFLFFLNETYLSAYNYVPILCIATIFNCSSTFAGVTYIVMKNSSRAFVTTFLGVFINLTFNFIFIKYIGLYGVAIGTAIGYLSVMYIRFFDMKKIQNISLNLKKFNISILVLSIEAFFLINIKSNIKLVIIEIFVIIILFIIFFKEIKIIILSLYNKINKNNYRINNLK